MPNKTKITEKTGELSQAAPAVITATKPTRASFTKGAVSPSEVVVMTTMSPSTLYRLIRTGDFPKPAKLKAKTFWSRSIVVAWIEGRYSSSN